MEAEMTGFRLTKRRLAFWAVYAVLAGLSWAMVPFGGLVSYAVLNSVLAVAMASQVRP